MVQDLFATHDVQVNPPTTMKGVNQLPAETVVRDRVIASKRVHVERVIGLAKTFKILQREIRAERRPLMDKIIYVCFAFVNFRCNIIPKHC